MATPLASAWCLRPTCRMASPDSTHEGHLLGNSCDTAALAIAVIHRTLRPPAGDLFAGDDAAATQPACLQAQGRGRYLPSPIEVCTLLVSLRGSLGIDSIDGVFRRCRCGRLGWRGSALRASGHKKTPHRCGVFFDNQRVAGG